MNTRNRIVHVLFVLVLLLGITPIVTGAPAAGNAPRVSVVDTMPAPPARSSAPSSVIPASTTAYTGTATGDARLDHSFDPGYDPNRITKLHALALQPDGKVIIGGALGSLGDVGIVFARLNTDGSRDTTFNPSTWLGGVVYALALQPDGKILAAGPGRGDIFRINADGSRDTTFDTGAGVSGGDTVKALALQPDGKIIIGGDFTFYDGVARNGIARLNADGSLDTTFDPGGGIYGAIWQVVDALALQPDGKILVGGMFEKYNGASREGIARINPDGSLDTTFRVGSGISGVISNPKLDAFALQPDGKIVIGGSFYEYDGVARKSIARVNTDGSLDATFDPDGGVAHLDALALQPDGKIVIGGDFDFYDGVARDGIARVNADGSLDTTFDPGSGLNGSNERAQDLALQPDGKIILCGDFEGYDGYNLEGVARLIGPDKFVIPASNVTYRGVVTYTLNLRNDSDQPDPHVVLTDTLPADVDFVQWVEQPTGATMVNDELTWSGALTVSEVITFTFQAQHIGDYQDRVLNTATYSGDVISGTMHATFWVQDPPPLYAIKGAPQPYVAHGETLTYTLRVGNSTALTITNVAITDTLPAVLTATTFISDSAALALQPGSHYAWSLAELPPGETVHITVTGVISPDAPFGPFDNTLHAASLISATLVHSDTVTAFVVPPTYTLTIATTGTGSGSVTPTVGSHVYPHHQSVTLYATPSPTSTFDGWSGDPDCTDGQVLIDADKTCTATFTTMPALTMAITGTGSGTVSPTVGMHYYYPGSVVTLTATPAPLSAFIGWSGDPDCADGQVLMNADKTCTATFTQFPTLTIAITGTGSGTVSPTVGMHYYYPGSVITLNAIPATTSTFVEWTGDASGPWRPVTVTIDGDKAITATFDLKPTCSTEPWHVFLGGSGRDSLNDMITDDFCNVYVVGESDAAWGSPIRAHSAITEAQDDVFVAMLDADHNLVWNTFLGGLGDDERPSLALDDAGNLYVSGISDDVTWGAPLQTYTTTYEYRRIYGFVAQLNAASGALNWHTFIGDDCTGIADVATGAGEGVYVQTCGCWSSGMYLPDNFYGNAVNFDAGHHVYKLDSSGAAVWDTFLGTNSMAMGMNMPCTVDHNNDLICQQWAGDNTVLGSPVSPPHGVDVLVAKFNTTDGAMLWHTYLGADEPVIDQTDSASSRHMAVDAANNIYLKGSSNLTWGSPVAPFPGGESVDWIAKLDTDGALQWHTFFSVEGIEGTATDSSGALYAVGRDDEAWGTPAQPYSGGSDALGVQLDPDTGDITGNTFLGGGAGESARAIDADNSDTMLLAGSCRCEWGAPLIPHSGSTDAWVASWDAAVGGAVCYASGDMIKTAEDVDGAPLYAGDLIRYTIALTNSGGLTMTNAVVTDTLPDGLTFVSASPAPDGGTNPPVWNLGTLNLGDTWTAVITASVNGSESRIYSNRAELGCTEDCSGSAYASLPNSNVQPGLEVEKTGEDVNGGDLFVGDLVRYTVTVTNVTSRMTQTHVRVTDTLPFGLVFVAASPTQDGGPDPLTWDVGSLAPGASWTMVFTTSVRGGSVRTNYAYAGSDQSSEVSDSAYFSNSSVQAGIIITKTAEDVDGAPLYAGDLVRYTVRITNTSSYRTMTGVLVTDTLPAGVTFDAASPGGYGGPNPLTWTVGTLTPGAAWSAVITVAVDGDVLPIGGNVAEFSSDQQGAQRVGPIVPPEPIGEPSLTIAQTGTGDGVVTPTVGVHYYVSPTVVALQATPSPTSTFEGWSGDPDCADGSVTMTANKACTATFNLFTAPPKLSISKTAEEYQNAPPLLVGDRILYTIRVTNTTTGTLTNLTVTDTLPAGVTFFQVPKGPSRPFTRDGQQVVWERASLAAGDSLIFHVIVKATGDPTPIGDNTATVTCAEDPTPRAATANLDDANVQEALTLLKDAVDLNGAPLLVDDVIRYTIHVTNAHATVTMTHVVVTDTLPVGTVFVTATHTYTEAAGTLWWQAGDLAPGASWTVAIDQRVDGSANPIAGNHAAVWSDQQDWQGTGNVYPPDPVIQTQLKLSKTAEEYRNTPPLLENDQILYTIRVTNTTTGALTNLRITDTLPAGVAFFQVPKGPSRPYTQNGQQVVWERSNLAAGTTLVLQVIAKVDGSANPIGVNVVQAICAEEALPAAATAQVAGDGVHEPGLVVTGTVAGGGGTMMQVHAVSALDVGNLLTYTVMVTNSNDSLTLNNLAVTVTLPSGAEWVRMTPAGSTALLPVLVWHQATLGPGIGWRATIVVSQTSETIGTMHAVATSDEQSPVEVTIGQGNYRIYLPLVMREGDNMTR